MRRATVIWASATAGFVALAGAATAAEPIGNKFNYQKYVDKYAGSAASSPAKGKTSGLKKHVDKWAGSAFLSSGATSVKSKGKKLAGLKSFPNWQNQVLNGSGTACEPYKRLWQSTGDWRWISRYYACRY